MSRSIFRYLLCFAVGIAAQSAVIAAPPAPLRQVWTVDEGLQAPESAYYDAKSGFLFLSQIGGGGGKAKDGDGWITQLTKDGQVVKAKWATGLNAPKGIRSHDNTLWVSDIDRIVAFDIKTGKQLREVRIEGAQFLNDLATDSRGVVYVSDMQASRIYRHADGKTTIFADGPQIEHPNGLLVHGDELIVGGWGQQLQDDFSTKVLGRLHAINLKTGKQRTITADPTGHLDGIEADGRGGFIVTDWRRGKVFHIRGDGKTTLLMETPRGAADLAYLIAEDLLILPEMMENKLTAFQIRGTLDALMPKTIGKLETFHPDFAKLLPDGAEIELLAGGFMWTEGPVWDPVAKHLLFSDIPNNRILSWTKDNGVNVFMQPSGYTGEAPFTGFEPGTNGLTFDKQGRLVMCCHGDRAIKRVEKDGSATVLASHYNGKRLNSPNDLVYHSNGDLYFTDPPYGLPKRYDDPARELEFCGVYRLTKSGKVELLTTAMTRPNGIGLSPDEKTLYVAQSDGNAPIWRAFDVQADGTLGDHRVFADASPWIGKLPGGCDGMAIDTDGRVWATGPGGVLVFRPDGVLLGRINTGQRTANCAFGDDGSTLYLMADDYIARIRTTVKGLGF